MNKKDYKGMFVFAESFEGKLLPVAFELCCEVRKLCDASGDALTAVAIGELNEVDIESLKQCGVDRIITVKGSGYDRYNTEAYTAAFTELSLKYKPSAIFVGATSNGRDFAPRFAARLETGCTSDATELIYNPGTEDIEFVEPAAGGKIMAVITIPVLRPQVGTIRPGTFKIVPCGAAKNVEMIEENISFDESNIKTKLIEYVPDEFDPELDIANSEVIICVGNGLKEEQGLQRYYELAKLMGGKVACTRPLVDREYLPYKLQIGQSGVMVKPKLYIGFGVSGAVNHVVGVDAGKFVAVNTDPLAPIFNYCDYGIVGDMDEVCDAMIEALKNK